MRGTETASPSWSAVSTRSRRSSRSSWTPSPLAASRTSETRIRLRRRADPVVVVDDQSGEDALDALHPIEVAVDSRAVTAGSPANDVTSPVPGVQDVVPDATRQDVDACAARQAVVPAESDDGVLPGRTDDGF